MNTKKLGRWFCRSTAALAAAVAARGYILITDNDGYVITWEPGTINLEVKLSTAATNSDGTSLATSVQAAVNAWNGYIGLVQFATQVSAAGGYELGDAHNEIVMDSTIDGDTFDPGTLAVTISYRSGDTRVNSDIVFNSAYTWKSYRGALQATEDIRRVAIHELGHVLGLDHPDQGGQSVPAIMNAYVSNLDTMQSDDVQGAQALYGAPGFVPGNNNFAQAATLAVSAGTSAVSASGTNIGATAQAGEPAHAGETARRTVWWKWTAAKSGTVTVTTQGSNFDTVLGIYTGASVSSLTEIASNDDEQSGVIRTSAVTFPITANTTYYAVVDGWDGEFGQIFFQLIIPSAATIVTQPSSQTVRLGQNAQFSVVANGSSPLAYQWQAWQSGSWQAIHDNSQWTGTRTATLSVSGSAISILNGVSFRCTVTNSIASATSNAATLSVVGGVKSDFDGDRLSEPLWRNSGTGEIRAWFLAGGSAGYGYEGGGWLGIGSGDFNGDGRSEPLWRNTGTDEIRAWFISGGSAGYGTEGGGWSVIGSGDFDGDGRWEPLWHSTATGEVRTWFAHGGSVGYGSEGGGWSVIGSGDFDGDGTAEPLWRNSGTGEVRVWFINGGSVGFGHEGDGWTIIPNASADFDGDGRAEPLWRNSGTGEVRTWLITGGSVGFGKEGGGWTAIGVGDFDGNGRSEPLWHNTVSGEVRTWFLTGGSVGYGNEGAGWSVMSL